MVEKTTLHDAFRNACEKEAYLYTMLLSGRGDKGAAFHTFAGAFRYLYALAINNAKLRDAGGSNDTKLVDEIQAWFDTAKSHSDATEGIRLFKSFNIALGQMGLL